VAAGQSGFGRIVDIRAVGRQAARYVSKYLGKEMRAASRKSGSPLPKWHRRATWSKGWAPEFRRSWLKWRADRRLAEIAWFVANGSPLFVEYQLRWRGFEIAEVDYGDRPLSEQSWELSRLGPFRLRSRNHDPRACGLCLSADCARRRAHGPVWLTPRELEQAGLA
jgi:hypothetical protein